MRRLTLHVHLLIQTKTGQGGMGSLKTLMKEMPQHMAKARMYACHLALAKDLNTAYNPAVQKCNTKEQVCSAFSFSGKTAKNQNVLCRNRLTHTVVLLFIAAEPGVWRRGRWHYQSS